MPRGAAAACAAAATAAAAAAGGGAPPALRGGGQAQGACGCAIKRLWLRNKPILGRHEGKTILNQNLSQFVPQLRPQVPSWLRPFRLLSNGEQQRVLLAANLCTDGDVAAGAAILKKLGWNAQANSLKVWVRILIQ